MTSHAECRHAASPEARKSCRMARAVLAVAERYGLVIEDVSDASDVGRVIPQYIVRTQRDYDWDTRLLITAGFRTPHLSVREATGHWKDYAWKRGLGPVSWMSVMRDHN